MSERRLVAMRRRLEAQEAARRVARLADEADARVERTLYYPFHAWRATGRLRSIVGSRSVACDGVVDALTAEAATIDVLDTVAVALPAADTMPVRCDRAAAREIARSFAAHVLRKRLRVLCDFGLEVQDLGLVHRPYWVISAGARCVLVDAVSGALHPLAAEAAVGWP